MQIKLRFLYTFVHESYYIENSIVLSYNDNRFFCCYYKIFSVVFVHGNV